MKDKSAVQLLRIEADHNAMIDKINSVVDKDVLEPDTFYVELFGIVLDEFGMPEDNTVELSAKYEDIYKRPDCFCRDFWWDAWYDLSRSDYDDEELLEFVRWLRKESKRMAIERRARLKQ